MPIIDDFAKNSKFRFKRVTETNILVEKKKKAKYKCSFSYYGSNINRIITMNSENVKLVILETYSDTTLRNSVTTKVTLVSLEQSETLSIEYIRTKVDNVRLSDDNEPILILLDNKGTIIGRVFQNSITKIKQ